VALDESKLVVLWLYLEYERKTKVAENLQNLNLKSSMLEGKSSNKDKGLLIPKGSRAFLKTLVKFCVDLRGF